MLALRLRLAAADASGRPHSLGLSFLTLSPFLEKRLEILELDRHVPDRCHLFICLAIGYIGAVYFSPVDCRAGNVSFLPCEVSTICISERYWLLSVATAHGGIGADEQEQSAKATSERTPLTTKKRTTPPLRAKTASGAQCLAPTPKLDQKSSVRRPHRVKLPSSTDQSEAVNPNSLPSLIT